MRVCVKSNKKRRDQEKNVKTMYEKEDDKPTWLVALSSFIQTYTFIRLIALHFHHHHEGVEIFFMLCVFCSSQIRWNKKTKRSHLRLVD